MIIPSSTKLVVFDLDGTLLDSMGGLASCAISVLTTHYGLSVPAAKEAYLTTSGIPFFQQLEWLYPKDPRNTLANSEFTELKKRSYATWNLFNGAARLLDRLKDAGIAIAISSNSEHYLVKRLVREQELDIDCALGWQPDFVKGPAHINYLTQHFGVQKSETIFVGDSLWDAKLAEQSGVSFIAKLGTLSEKVFKEYHADIPTIEHLHELEALLTPWSPSYSLPAMANA